MEGRRDGGRMGRNREGKRGNKGINTLKQGRKKGTTNVVLGKSGVILVGFFFCLIHLLCKFAFQ